MRRRAFNLVAGLLLISPPAMGNPFDFGRFLEAWKLSLLVGSNHIPLQMEGLAGEHYAYMDETGNQYLLIPVADRAYFLDHLIATQLSTVLGMPHSPSWPTLIQRGREPVIPARISQYIFPWVRPALEREPWIPGVVQPLWDRSRVPGYDATQPLTAVQLADLSNFFVFSYVFGLQVVPQPYVTGDRLVAGGLAAPFAAYKEGKPIHGTYRNFLRKVNLSTHGAFPVDRLRAIAADEKERTRFFTVVNDFLSRLEALAESELLGKLVNLSKRVRGATATRMLADVKKTIAGIRAEVMGNLAGIDRGFASPPGRITRDLTPYYVDFSKFDVKWTDSTPQLDAEWKYRAKDFVLHYLVSEDAPARRMEADWARALNTTDALAVIWDAATQYDSRPFLAYQERYKVGDEASGETYPQWYLNRSIGKVLVVASESDFESQAIRSLTQRLAKQLPNIMLYPGLDRRGENRGPLQDSEFDAILAFATANGIRNVVVCELGEMGKTRFDLTEAHGMRLIHLDHHRQNSKKRSTLEQFARAMGYELTLDEYVTAIIDRAGIGGLSGMGMTKSELYEYLRRTRQLDRVNNVLDRIEATVRSPATMGPDTSLLLRVAQPEGGRMSAVTLPLAYHYFPHTPHVLIESARKVRFHGPWAVCEGLRGLLEPKLNGKWVWGGDLRTGYVLFTPRDRSTTEDAADQFEATLRRLHPYSCSKRLEIYPAEAFGSGH